MILCKETSKMIHETHVEQVLFMARSPNKHISGELRVSATGKLPEVIE